jgi:hypothetical protein
LSQLTILAIGFGFLAVMIIAMILTAKKNAREQRERMIKAIKHNRLNSRVSKWRRVATEWNTELKKPVKVSFT